MPAVTVLMSTYNERPAILGEAVESILKQSYVDFELLIINDNPDNGELGTSLSLISSRDSRVRIVTNERNLGLALSLNRGLELAKGNFICRMDADDISEPNRIERQLSYLRSFELDLVGSAMTVIDETGQTLYAAESIPHSPDAVAKALRFNNCVPHPTWLGKREVFSQGYRQIPLCEDYDFLIRAVLQNRKVGNAPERLVRYRMSQESVSRTRLYEQYLYQLELTRAYANGRPINPSNASKCVSEKLSDGRAERYASANTYFNQGLSLLRSRRFITAIGQLLRVPFTSFEYMNKVYRLVRTALVRS